MNYIRSESTDEINDGIAFLCLDRFLDDLVFVEEIGNHFISRWGNSNKVEIDDSLETIFDLCEFYNFKLLKSFYSRDQYDVTIKC